jgi:hypothetical protein
MSPSEPSIRCLLWLVRDLMRVTVDRENQRKPTTLSVGSTTRSAGSRITWAFAWAPMPANPFVWVRGSRLSLAASPLDQARSRRDRPHGPRHRRHQRGGHRDVAQPGSAPALGAGGREFDSPRPDHIDQHTQIMPKSTRSVQGRTCAAERRARYDGNGGSVATTATVARANDPGMNAAMAFGRRQPADPPVRVVRFSRISAQPSRAAGRGAPAGVAQW